MKTLYDWLPADAIPELSGTPVARKFGYTFIKEGEGRWPGPQKNVRKWCIVEGGTPRCDRRVAVGWNENPSRGWSFPIAALDAAKREGKGK